MTDNFPFLCTGRFKLLMFLNTHAHTSARPHPTMEKWHIGGTVPTQKVWQKCVLIFCLFNLQPYLSLIIAKAEAWDELCNVHFVLFFSTEPWNGLYSFSLHSKHHVLSSSCKWILFCTIQHLAFSWSPVSWENTITFWSFIGPTNHPCKSWKTKERTRLNLTELDSTRLD